MARIQRFSSRVEAELAASMLTAHGIEAVAVSDDTGGMHPNLAFGLGGSEVVVPDDLLEEATALLDGEVVPVGAAGDGPPWGPGPDEGRARTALSRWWLRVGAAVLAIGILLVVLTAELELRWY